MASDRVLGIDPGATVGWCVYSTVERRAIASGEFQGDDLPDDVAEQARLCSLIVIESLHDPHANIYPATVRSAITQGHIERQLHTYERMTRHDVKRVLTAAVLREPVVTDDATAWKAVVRLHGEGCDAKPRKKKGVVISPGGALGAVTGHARAALAVAVAFTLRQSQTTGGVL